MAKHFADNPQIIIIVNGFVKVGITAALDGRQDQQEELHEKEDDSKDDLNIFLVMMRMTILTNNIIKYTKDACI